MENYNNVPNKGTVGGMVSAINANFALTKEILERLENTKDKSLGVFPNAASLVAAYPSPHVGDWALVGTSSPFTVYTCEAEGTWTQGGTYDAGTIDLSGYASKADVQEIEDLIDGGTEETTATTTWTDNSVVKPATGSAPESSSYSSYSASDFITINPSRATSVRLMHVFYKNATGMTELGLAFYDANQTYISGHNYSVDESVSSATMEEATFSIPSGARYLRTTCKKTDKGTWYCYFQAQKEGLIDRVSGIEGDLDNVRSLAEEAETDAQAALDAIDALDDPSYDVYKKADDPEGNGAYNTARYGAGFYTPKFQEDKTFNRVILKGVYAPSSVSVEWRVYSYSGAAASGGTDDQPKSGTIGNSHTLLANGTVTVAQGGSDVTLTMGNVTCPAGEQVIIYLMEANGAGKLSAYKVSGTTIPEDTHGTIYNTGGWSDTWSIGAASNTYTAHAPVLRWESPMLSRTTVQEMIDEALEGIEVSQDLEICLPSTIHCLVGSEINLYNDNLSLSVDKGLQSPLNYQVEWNPSDSSSVRKIARGVRIRPSAAGSFTLSIRLKDEFDHTLAEKTITVVAVAKNALATAKNILMVGSSSCPDTSKEVYNIFADSNRYTGTVPTMVGTLTTGGAHHEGRGGWKWSSYTSAAPGGVANPFWNTSTSRLDIANYRTSTLGMSGSIDLVLFELGLNDFIQHITTTPKTVQEYYNSMSGDVNNMDTLINAFLADNPNTKIVLALPYICENTNGLGRTKTASYSNWEFNKASYAMRLRYMEYVEAHPTYILTAGHQMADRYWGFPLVLLNISERYAEYRQGGKEKVPSDPIHTGTVGHRQYADGFAATIIGTLGTTTTGGTVGYTDEVNYGDNDEVPSGGGAGSTTDQTARDAAAAAQTTANTALTAVQGKQDKGVGLLFDIYNTDTNAPTDSGTTTEVGTLYYFTYLNTFMMRVGNSYYSTFPHSSDYMAGGVPIYDKVYLCGDKPYMADGTDGQLKPLLSGAVPYVCREIINSLVSVVTEAQYEAMSASEKAAKIYFIIESQS